MTKKNLQGRKIRRIVAALWMGCASGRDILTGIFRYAKTRIGWDIRLVQLPNIYPERIGKLAAEGVDGLITSDLSNRELRELVDSIRPPVVFIGAPDGSMRARGGGTVSFVSCDDTAIGAMGARHFLSRGSFNSYGFVHSGIDTTWTNLREQGFRKALASTGKECRSFVSRNAADERMDPGPLADWLKSLPKPAAVMTYYDPQAVQIANVCRELGLAVPRQVSILGVDNDGLLCEFSDPPLSSVQPDHERAGYLAAQELNVLMSHPLRRPRTLVCPVIGVVERESTSPISPAAHLVKKARQFMHDQAAKGISVADVATYLGVSRRLADLRFRELENQSIHQAIEDRQMEIAEKALSDSKKAIRRIAAESGYRNIKTFEAAFRRRHGLSPSEYRENVISAGARRVALLATAFAAIFVAEALCAGIVMAAEPASATLVAVDFSRETGSVKPVNGVGQPPMVGQLSSWPMFRYLKEAGIPYSRLHDVGGWLGHGLYVDIPNLFPNFDADETNAMGTVPICRREELSR